LADLPFERHEIDRSSLPPELAEMLDQSERDYVGWNPAERPQVAGTVADIQANCDCGGYGPHNIVFVDQPNGEGVAIHVFHTILRSQLEDKIRTGKLQQGDLIVVAFAGTTPSKTKGHADQNNYRVVIRQQGVIVPKA
jgi:hypothetical protein